MCWTEKIEDQTRVYTAQEYNKGYTIILAADNSFTLLVEELNKKYTRRFSFDPKGQLTHVRTSFLDYPRPIPAEVKLRRPYSNPLRSLPDFPNLENCISSIEA